ncbi:hypothetical protein GE09DRAFT_1159394 [Coniochaeta sp. 2T2.1]|nr:hypothetical protein GE09DRAFT_1159394 [Coniochaeta sp. 2T2.1]
MSSAALLKLDRNLRPPPSCAQKSLVDTISRADFIDRRIDHMRAHYASKNDHESLLAVNTLANRDDVANKVQEHALRLPEDEPCCDRDPPSPAPALAAPQHVCHLCTSSQARLGEHLTWVHELQRCSACCLDCLQMDCARHDKEHMWEHLATHGRVHCADCDVSILTSSPLSSHRVRRHGWVQCPVCDDAVPTRLDRHLQTHPACEVCGERLRDDNYLYHTATEHDYRQCPVPTCEAMLPTTAFHRHIATSHSGAQAAEPASSSTRSPSSPCTEEYRKLLHAECSECGRRILDGGLDEHLCQAHEWLQCPWCEKPHSEDSLRTHMQVSHPPREQCRICRANIDVDGLNHHMVVCHQWHKCLYCDGVISPDEVDQHLTNEHHATPCQECNELLPESNHRHHLELEHSYVECCECNRLLPDSKRRTHLSQEHHYVECCFCDHFDARDRVQEHILKHVPNASQPLTRRPPKGRRDMPLKCQQCREHKVKVRNSAPLEQCERCAEDGEVCSAKTSKEWGGWGQRRIRKRDMP